MPIPASAVALKPEDCVSVDPDRGLELLWLIAAVVLAKIIGLVIVKVFKLLVRLPVFRTSYTVSILYYKSAVGRFTV